MFTVEYAKDLKWCDSKHTMFECVVKYAEFDEEMPCGVNANDRYDHIKTVWEKGVAGDFGPIAEYVPPPLPADITGEDALNAVRSKRNNLLTTEVDPIVSNPLRWADLSTEQQQALADYRRSLLDITSAYPNPSYVWNEEKQGYDEVGIVWPVKPE